MSVKIRLPRVLVTNDDGADAPGLALLVAAVAEMAEEVWTVAPERDQSGAGMMVSLRETVRMTQRGQTGYVVRGSSADCVAIGLNHLMKDKPPQLVLAGVNAGANAGDEANLSGTVGAALMGVMFGVPSIAISQETSDRKNPNWEPARMHLPNVLQILLQQGWRRDSCLSVNFPDTEPGQIRDIAWTRQAQKSIAGIKVEERIDLRGNSYHLLAVDRKQAEPDPLSDIAALRRKRISVTCLTLDRSIEPGRRLMPLDPQADEHVGT